MLIFGCVLHPLKKYFFSTININQPPLNPIKGCIFTPPYGAGGAKTKTNKMKKYKFFALAFAAMTLAACSSDDVVDDGGKGNLVGGETGYVSLNLNLPTQPSTRAANDNFAEGTSDEYAVKDGVLLLFKGASESAATLASAYNLDVATAGFAADGSDQIDSKGTIVQQITVPSTSAGDKIYALAVLNANGLITVSNDNKSASIGSTSLAGKTLSDITSLAVSADGAKLTANGFFMSNAPLFSGTSTGAAAPAGSAVTLAEVDPEKIYSSQSEASMNGNAAADIYVERAVAKVTVKSNATTPENSKITALTVDGWTLNVTNNKTYLVRNVAPATSWWGYASASTKETDKYRFVGTNAVKTGYYRTYWGIDPNYNQYVAADFTNNSLKELDNKALTACDGTTPLYCAENTFDVDNMNENQTTAVIVKAKLTVTGADTDGSFYTINGNNSTIYQKTDIENYVKSLVQAWIETNKATYIKNGTVDGTDLTVTLSNSTTDGNKGGMVTVTKVEYTGDGITDWADGQRAETLNEGIAAALESIMANTNIAYYKGGESYYAIRIKHFGDDLTPWGNNVTYTDSEADLLGRYGVLRNNWYDITVNSITNIGSPSVPEVTEEQDDPTASYISATINVLSWAKREQSVNL